MNGMPAGAGSEIQQEVHTMTHEEMLREYTRSYKNMLSASAQRRLEELEVEAAREGLRFQMINEAQWVLPHFIGDPRFELIPA